MGDNDDTPTDRPKRARSEPGTDQRRDVYQSKHGEVITTRMKRSGMYPVVLNDDMTPPPVDVSDPIEVAALRMDVRRTSIVRRHGPTPTEGALTAAITTHAVRTEVQAVLVEELKKDRELRRELERASGLQDIMDRGKTREWWRAFAWKVAAGLFAIATTILAAILASK